MVIDDRLSPFETFESIVGQRQCQGNFPGDVPDFEIGQEEVDKTYLEIKKMQRCDHDCDDNLNAQYYKPSFEAIEKSYLDGNFKAFKEAVYDLMVKIDAN